MHFFVAPGDRQRRRLFEVTGQGFRIASGRVEPCMISVRGWQMDSLVRFDHSGAIHHTVPDRRSRHPRGRLGMRAPDIRCLGPRLDRCRSGRSDTHPAVTDPQRDSTVARNV